jgi:hypothetical protein
VAGSPPAAAPPAVVAATPPAAVVEAASPPTRVVETEEIIEGEGSPPATMEPGFGEETGGAAAQPAAGEQADLVSADRPSGAPEVSVLFVAWSRVPSERVVSMRVAAGSLNVVHEGEYVEGLQVSAIHPESVDLSWTGQKFRVAVNPF